MPPPIPPSAPERCNGSATVAWSPGRPTAERDGQPASDVSIMDADASQAPAAVGLALGWRGVGVRSWGSRRCLPSRARPLARRRASSTSASRVCRRHSTRRMRAIRRSSSRFASSTRACSDSASVATSSRRSRPHGACRETGSRGRSGSARTCSCTTARRLGRTRSYKRSPSGSRRTSRRRARLRGPARSAGRPGLSARCAAAKGRRSRSSSRSRTRPSSRSWPIPGLAIAVPAVRRPPGRERALPGRRAHAGAARAGNGPDLAGRARPRAPV